MNFASFISRIESSIDKALDITYANEDKEEKEEAKSTTLTTPSKSESKKSTPITPISQPSTPVITTSTSTPSVSSATKPTNVKTPPADPSRPIRVVISDALQQDPQIKELTEQIEAYVFSIVQYSMSQFVESKPISSGSIR